MIHLLDINVLIALCDPAHPHSGAALSYFNPALFRNGWATCPLVENGFLRIFGSPRYPGGPGSPALARVVLGRLTAAPGHHFWPDDASLRDLQAFPALPTSASLTDLYLLGLAVKHGGRFATFDAGVDASLIPGGPKAYHVIPTA